MKIYLAMKQFLVHVCGRGCWTLYVDVDELWLYPGCNTIDLSRFINYLDRAGYNAWQAHMLDMFQTSNFPTTAKDSNFVFLVRIILSLRYEVKKSHSIDTLSRMMGNDFNIMEALTNTCSVLKISTCRKSLN